MVLNIIERLFVSTDVILPDYALEFAFSEEFFSLTGSVGYCFDIDYIPTFIGKMFRKISKVKNNKIRAKLFDELNCFDSDTTHLPDNIRYICVFVAAPKRIITNIVNYKAVRNHERTHAHTLIRDQYWHDWANYILYETFGSDWLELSDIIINMPAHQGIQSYYGSVWVAVTEILARFAAILHARPWFRKSIAKAQFRPAPDKLLVIIKKFKKEFASVDEFIEYIDEVVDAA